MYTSVKAALDGILKSERLIYDEIAFSDRPLDATRIVESLGSLADKVMAKGRL